MLTKVISGGQQGIDIAALRAAKAVGLSTGGWMPKGFRTEAGPHPEYTDLFGLREMPTTGYPPRTRKNVEDADATLILCYKASAGIGLTLKCARELVRPVFWVPASHQDGALAPASFTFHWVIAGKVKMPGETRDISHLVPLLSDLSITILNVAGNLSADEAEAEKWLTQVFRTALATGKEQVL